MKNQSSNPLISEKNDNQLHLIIISQQNNTILHFYLKKLIKIIKTEQMVIYIVVVHCSIDITEMI